MAGKARPVALRFWAKVNKNGPVAPGMTTPCWLWTGAIYPMTSRARGNGGYGAFRDETGRTRGAHRVGYELQNGPIPRGLHACHHCDVRACVRGDHLFAGDDRANQRDSVQKGRASPPPHGRGEANGNSRLTEVQVREIRARHAAGERQVLLARAFGVSQAAVSKIVRREWWSHVA